MSDQIKSIKLYHYPLSRSVRTKWMLHEVLGEEFEVERVPLLQGGQFSEAFLDKNPNHGVPVLDVIYSDSTTQSLFESGAQLIWLADSYSEKGLAPALDDVRGRADYLQMMHFGGSWMDMMLWQIRLNEDLLPKKVRSPALAQFNRDKLKNEVEPQLERRLGEHDYICGDHFTAADCMIGHNVGWARAYGLCLAPVFDAYHSRLAKREAFKLAYADADSFGT
jgi:glutathione S-transferase